MNANQIYQIVLLVCVLSALVISRRLLRPAQKTNTNEIVPKAGPRMNRIQKVSKGIRLFLQYGIPLIIIGFLALTYLEAAHKITLPKPSHPSEMGDVQHPGAFQLWSILSLVVYLFWYRTALKLFGFFEKGILFTAETVRCIQILGSIYLIRFFVQLSLFLFAPSADNHWLGAGSSDLFTGFLIIFIGWLIDEARKIQEEQELTV